MKSMPLKIMKAYKKNKNIINAPFLLRESIKKILYTRNHVLSI